MPVLFVWPAIQLTHRPLMHARDQARLPVLHKQQTTSSRHPTAAPTFLEDELRGSHITLPHHGQRIARHPRGQLPASRGASKTALAARRCRHDRRPAAGSLRSRAVAVVRDGGGHRAAAAVVAWSGWRYLRTWVAVANMQGATAGRLAAERRLADTGCAHASLAGCALLAMTAVNEAIV